MTLDLFNYTGFKGALGEIKLDADGGLIKQFNVYAQLGDDYDDEDGNGLLASVDIEGEFKFVGRPFLNFDGSDYVPPDKSLYPICNRGEEARLRYDEYVCIPCAEGTYNMDHNSTCKLCPQGGVCRDGINVLTRQNYWKNPAASSLNKAFYTCGVGGSCCQSPTGCTWDNQCQNNMEGPLCGSCEPGLYSWNGQCVSCDVYSPGPLLALLLAYGAVVVALFVLPKNASGFFEDLVNFYQIAGFVFIQQSTTADSVIDFMELRFEVRMHSHPCVAPFSPIQKEVRGLFTPLIMLAWFGVLALAAITSRRLLGSTVAVKYWHKIQDLPLQQNLYATLYCIGLFCYGPLLETCIGFMDCVRVENFGWFMRVNPGVQCWADGQHISVAVFAIISCIVLMIPGPLILLRRLRHLRRTDRMSYPASMLHLVQMPLRPKAGVVPKAVSNEDVAFADQMLYSEFKPSLWFWLPLDVIMRALIYLLATLLGGIPNGRTLSVLFTAYVYLLIFIFVQPAATLVDNAVRIVTYISLVALSSFALAESLHLQDPNNITALSQGVPGAFLAIPIVLVPLKLPWRKMLKLRGEPKEGVAEAVDIIVKSFDSIAAEFHSRRGSKVSMHRGTSRTGDSGHTAGPEMSLMATADRPRKSSTLYPPGFEPVDNEEFA
ncbi:hypothetical protein DFS34DRAFT_509534 [Phlyctochytrium arcticum]|nr:hypothetical protein DFS34DRAFT_509534 [Phlyctochytrium arcticum]